MFNLTRQEKSVILFLSGVAVTGIGARYLLKTLPPEIIAVKKGQAAKESKKVNINQAGREELVSLRGIGTALAERILEYRRLHGSFIFVDDLKKVKGIGAGKLEKIKEHIVIE